MLETVHEVWHNCHPHTGRKWWEKIRGRLMLARCDGFVYLLSAESIESEYCQKEYVLARESSKLIFVIKVRSNFDFPEYLLMDQVLDFSDGITSEAVALFLIRMCVAEAEQQNCTSRLVESGIGSPAYRMGKFLTRVKPIIMKISRFGAFGVIGLLKLWMSLGPMTIAPISEPALVLTVDTETQDATSETDDPEMFDMAPESAQKDDLAAEIPDEEKTGNAADELDITRIRHKIEELSIRWYERTEDPDISKVREAIDELLERLANSDEDQVKKAKRQKSAAMKLDKQLLHRPWQILASIKQAWKSLVLVLVTLTLVTAGLAWAGAFDGGPQEFIALPLKNTSQPPSAAECQAAGLSEISCIGVTQNDDWTPFVEEVNGVAMALVPAGCFQMGNESAIEDPVRRVCFLEPFWIDVFEVTNGQFADFGGFAGRTGKWTEPDRPRVGITWYEAAAFCELRGARLPTEAEWEYAARGPDALMYPWGNTFVEDNAVYGGNSGGQTWFVGSKPDGVSWTGAYDLSGNVWEWVNDWYASGYRTTLPDGVVNPQGPGSLISAGRVRRAGSWSSSDIKSLGAADRFGRYPRVTDNTYGFRCALSY
jgi:formylglycine-generating enzyme required for sulfatase activity